MTKTQVIRGIECYAVWGSEDPIPVYISFGEWDEDNERYDSFGILDDNIFYYFTEDEQKKLIIAIANNQDSFRVTREWYIDLTEGIDFIKNTESN